MMLRLLFPALGNLHLAILPALLPALGGIASGLAGGLTGSSAPPPPSTKASAKSRQSTSSGIILPVQNISITTGGAGGAISTEADVAQRQMASTEQRPQAVRSEGGAASIGGGFGEAFKSPVIIAILVGGVVITALAFFVRRK